MLFVSCCLCPFAGPQVVFSQKVEQGSVAQADGFISLAFIVDKQWKLDAGLFAKEPGIAGIAQANHGQMSALLIELGFEFAQLRDVFSAEDSTVMTQEDHHGRSSLPQGAEPRWCAVGVWERDSG